MNIDERLALNTLLSQYALLQQSNDNVNLMQNALASGVPTLDIPSIVSYLGYNNTFQSNVKDVGNFELKYKKLLEVIEEIGRDVRPLYSGSKGASDRIRRQINQARQLVRDCLIEVERAQRS